MSIRKYTVYNFLGSIVPLCVTFVTVPIYLNLIGETRYGTLAIIWIMLGYFSLFDFGLSRAVAQQVAKIDEKQTGLTAEVFWSGLAISAVLGLIGGLILWPIAQFSSGFFNLDESIQTEFATAAPWLAVAVPILTITSVFSGALQARNRFAELNVISAIGTVLFQVAPIFAAVQFGPDLSVLVPVAIGARVFTLLAFYWACKKTVFKGQVTKVKLSLVKRLLRFGRWVAVSSIIGPLMVVLDRYVIGVLGGAQAVSYYSIPFQLAERSTVFARSLSSAIFPKLAANEEEETDRLLHRSYTLFLAFITPVSALGIYILPSFLSWWISAEFAARAGFAGQILVTGFWFNSLARLPHARLQADGRPHQIAYCHLAEVIPYLAVLYVGLTTYGLPGAAAAFSIRAAVDHIALSQLAGMLRSTWRSLSACSALLISALCLSHFAPSSQTLWVLVCTAQGLVLAYIMLPIFRLRWKTGKMST